MHSSPIKGEGNITRSSPIKGEGNITRSSPVKGEGNIGAYSQREDAKETERKRSTTRMLCDLSLSLRLGVRPLSAAAWVAKRAAVA